MLLTDLVGRLAGVSASSIDGFDVRPHLGAAPAGGPPWAILVDGLPLNTGAFGEVALHLLPVDVSEIERVTWCPGAGLAAGRFFSAGRLEISTNRDREARRWEAIGITRIANETGDPGPRRYFAGATGNVDKIGPDFAGAASAPVGTLAWRYERRYPTDVATYSRNRFVGGRFPMVRYGTAGAQAQLPGAVRLTGSGSYASDLWYLPAAGAELPVLRSGGQVAVVSGRSVARTAAGVRASGSGWSIQRRADIPDSGSVGLNPGWLEFAGTLDAEARRAGARGEWAAGLHLGGQSVSGPGVDGERAGLARAWLHRSASPTPSIRHRSDVALVAGGNHVGLEGAVSVERIFESGALSLTVIRDDQLPEEARGPAYWRSRGYRGLDITAVPYSSAGGFDRATEWALRLDGFARTAAHVTLRGSADIRDYSDLTIESGMFRPDSGDGLTGEVVALTGQGGRVVSFAGSASADIGPASWSVSYRFERAVAGHRAFRDAWASVAAHVARARVTWRPEALLALGVAAEARSGTSWPAYAAFEGHRNRDGYTYDSSTPAVLVVDFEAERALFGRRLLVTIAARNLFDADERTHPLGASLAFRLWVQAAFRL
jgi:hypothetical protein